MRANEHPRRILVCDSDLLTIRALRTVLRDAGLDVYVTQTAEDALARAALRVPDAVILEMTLVDSVGTDVCRQLRHWSSMPIIILSNVSDEVRVVDAFRAGATDYIIKPFRPRELLARIQTHLRAAAGHQDEPVIECGTVEIDLAARVVRRGSEQLRLTPIEHKLLCTLVRARGRLLTHDALLHNIWGAAYAEDRQTLRVHMANLRRKLGSSRERGPIRTYPGVGYLFDTSSDARLPATNHRSQPLRVARAA